MADNPRKVGVYDNDGSRTGTTGATGTNSTNMNSTGMHSTGTHSTGSGVGGTAAATASHTNWWLIALIVLAVLVLLYFLF